MLGDTRAQNGQGRDGESPKGSMHGAKGVRDKKWSTKLGGGGGWQGSPGTGDPPPRSDLQQVALLWAAFRGFFWGCWGG